jgi:hypothetical protein
MRLNEYNFGEHDRKKRITNIQKRITDKKKSRLGKKRDQSTTVPTVSPNLSTYVISMFYLNRNGLLLFMVPTRVTRLAQYVKTTLLHSSGFA